MWISAAFSRAVAPGRLQASIAQTLGAEETASQQQAPFNISKMLHIYLSVAFYKLAANTFQDHLGFVKNNFTLTPNDYIPLIKWSMIPTTDSSHLSSSWSSVSSHKHWQSCDSEGNLRILMVRLLFYVSHWNIRADIFQFNRPLDIALIKSLWSDVLLWVNNEQHVRGQMRTAS